jgi:transcriptional regulator with XRE-family HTH domain
MPRTTIDMQKEEAKKVAARVRWARELADMTFTELGAAIGVDSSTIRHIEAGIRLPSLHVLMALCHTLLISPQYLLWGSLEGVDQETAAQLKSRHPELHWPAAPADHAGSRKSGLSIDDLPRSRGRYRGATAIR